MQDINQLKAQRFYDKLRRKVASYCGDHSNLILLAPDFFALLLRLLRDKRVPMTHKGYLGAAIAYFITPFDLIPEGLLGPFGYLDDIVVAVLVLHKIVNDIDEEVVVENWSGQGNILALIQNILSFANTYFRRQLGWLKRKANL